MPEPLAGYKPVTAEKRVLACQDCGHLFDGDTGKLIPEFSRTVIERADRERTKCLPCVLLQNVSEKERSAWPDR
jgi:hypothetical protein